MSDLQKHVFMDKKSKEKRGCQLIKSINSFGSDLVSFIIFQNLLSSVYLKQIVLAPVFRLTYKIKLHKISS